ncbi:MAG: hypothetical protein IPP29_23000 [Bacteroidetes bacterium]|nr:hypothetical protein [Bacteroidota bacterium]
MDANSNVITYTGGVCNYPSAPVADVNVIACGDNSTLNIQDAAFYRWSKSRHTIGMV